MIAFDVIAVILDEDLDYVWWYRHVGEPADCLRVRLGRDGHSVLFAVKNQILRISLDGQVVESIPAPDNHHDFVELGDGTVVTLGFEEQGEGDDEILGDTVVEIAPDGSQRVVWRSLDMFPYEVNNQPDFPDLEMGWTHANALDYDPARDAYLVGVRNFHAVVGIDRSSGEPLWQLGGDQSDVVLPDGSTEMFFGQHQFELSGDRLLVFDNGSDERMFSEAVEYELDLDAGTAERSWGFRADPDLYCLAGGDVTRLPTGNTLVDWSFQGRLEEVTHDGEVARRMQFPLGAGLGYATWRADLLPVD